MMPKIRTIVRLTVAALLFATGPAAAAETRIGKDIDGDGTPDQTLIYDAGGTIIRVEVDADHDGYAERVQFYENGEPVRMVRDTDNDRKTDCTDIFRQGKRIRQERTDGDGQIVQIAHFGPDETLVRMEKDTTGDRRFDTIYHFQAGILAFSTKDTDANGRINVWTDFKHQIPTRQKQDHDEDGRIDQRIVFDAEGRILKLMKQPFGADRFGITGFFKNGELHTQHRDRNQDGKPDVKTWFENGHPVRQEKDANLDGRFDITTLFKNGIPASRTTDSDFDGKPDLFAEFDADGQMKTLREDTRKTGKIDRIRHYTSGEPVRTETDKDGNGLFETVSLIRDNQIRQNRIDKNQDGRFDTDLFFHANGHRDRLVSDTDFDGNPDVWQTYANDRIAGLERDENRDGQVDLKIRFKEGDKQRLEKDTDFDGYFDTVQVYDDPPWTMIVTRDANRDGHPEITTYFKASVLKRKDLDEDSDGRIDLKEHYTDAGVLSVIEELDNQQPVLTWFYDNAAAPVRAEEDADKNGHPDIWYFYENGLLVQVREDTNGDGQPDLWEDYDDTQAMVGRKKDLDFDGTPDFTDLNDAASGG